MLQAYDGEIVASFACSPRAIFLQTASETAVYIIAAILVRERSNHCGGSLPCPKTEKTFAPKVLPLRFART